MTDRSLQFLAPPQGSPSPPPSPPSPRGARGRGQPPLEDSLITPTVGRGPARSPLLLSGQFLLYASHLRVKPSSFTLLAVCLTSSSVSVVTDTQPLTSMSCCVGFWPNLLLLTSFCSSHRFSPVYVGQSQLGSGYFTVEGLSCLCTSYFDSGVQTVPTSVDVPIVFGFAWRQ